jgi:hypothetical protein
MAAGKYVGVSGITLTPNNLRKLHKHQGTIIKPTKGGEMEIFLSPVKAKKLANAMKKGKGMKLVMTPDELAHSTTHGKGVALPSRKIFTPPKEGTPTLIKKGMIAHKSSVEAVNAGNDTFQVLKDDPVATPAPPKRRRSRKTKVEEGGRIRSIKDVGRAIKKGVNKVTDEYKEFRNDPKNATARKMIQEGARQAIKAAIVSGATALGSTVGMPQAGVAAATVAPTLANMAVEKIGLGSFVLNDNYNNFLNPMHPAMSPALPPADMSMTRGSGFKSAGYGLRHRSGVTNNLQMLGGPLNPMLPPQDHSLPHR